MATGTRPAGTGRTAPAAPVLLAPGIVLGTALAILAMWGGSLILRIPGIGAVLGGILGAIVIWVLFMAAAAMVSELAARHHRAALRHSWRYSKRGGRAARRWGMNTYQRGATWSLPWRQRAIAYLRTRWETRGSELPMFRPATPGDSPGGPSPAPGDPGANPTAAPAAGPDGGTQMTDTTNPHPDAKPGGAADRDPRTWGSEPAERARRRPGGRAAGGGGYSPAWKALTAETGDFEPEDDGHLMDWMASEVNGMAAYAEALTEVYETGVSSIGLDPVSLAALHDTADAAADAAQAMAYARQKFAAHYSEVREFAAAGGVLPHDGRWITGEGE